MARVSGESPARLARVWKQRALEAEARAERLGAGAHAYQAHARILERILAATARTLGGAYEVTLNADGGPVFVAPADAEGRRFEVHEIRPTKGEAKP